MKYFLILLLAVMLAVMLAGCSVSADPFGATEREQIRADGAVQVAEQDRLAREAEAAAHSDRAYYWSKAIRGAVFWLAVGVVAFIAVVCAFGFSLDMAGMRHTENMTLINHAQQRWLIDRRAQHERDMASLVAQHLGQLELDDLEPMHARQFRQLATGAKWSVMDTDEETGERVGALVEKSGRVNAYRLLTG